jgi:hypothetical protein
VWNKSLARYKKSVDQFNNKRSTVSFEGQRVICSGEKANLSIKTEPKHCFNAEYLDSFASADVPNYH